MKLDLGDQNVIRKCGVTGLGELSPWFQRPLAPWAECSSRRGRAGPSASTMRGILTTDNSGDLLSAPIHPFSRWIDCYIFLGRLQDTEPHLLLGPYLIAAPTPHQNHPIPT